MAPRKSGTKPSPLAPAAIGSPQLFISSTNPTGYRNVYAKSQHKDSEKPFTVEKDDRNSLGRFATALEAAVAYANWKASLHADAVVKGCNGKLGPERRWLVLRAGSTNPEWDRAEHLPAHIIAAWEEEQCAAHNQRVEPSIGDGSGSSLNRTGVETAQVAVADADACARFLQQQWLDGALVLPNQRGFKIRGYSTYAKTLDAHDSEEQRTHTLLFTPATLPVLRVHVPGFEAIEGELALWLLSRFDTFVELHSAHALRQSPETLKSTTFGVHQDTEDEPSILYTVVVKLTADAPEEPPSEMRVVGAPEHFRYGPAAGSSGCFQAALHHASVKPSSEREHLKIAFFYKASTNRRAERSARARLEQPPPALPADAAAAAAASPEPPPRQRQQRKRRQPDTARSEEGHEPERPPQAPAMPATAGGTSASANFPRAELVQAMDERAMDEHDEKLICQWSEWMRAARAAAHWAGGRAAA